MAQDSAFAQNLTLNLKGRLISLHEPQVMGILNITPDSFYAESRVSTDKDLLSKTEKMLSEGATFIDLGGYSSRPGAIHIDEEEELKRILPAIDLLIKHFPDIILSIDTFRAGVAEKAIDHGCSIINDISGGQLDEEMFSTMARLKVPYILMHMRGTPQNMIQLTHYENLMSDIASHLSARIAQLRSMGLADIIIDPGFGFAKNIGQNFHLLKHLSFLKSCGCPILAGLSRKSMIYKTLGTSPEEALNGSTALHMIALMNGANILRTHDVKEASETIKLYLQVAAA